MTTESIYHARPKKSRLYFLFFRLGQRKSLTHWNLIMLLKLNLIFDPYTTNEMGQVVTLIPCIQSAVTTLRGGYHKGGVELVLPILFSHLPLQWLSLWGYESSHPTQFILWGGFSLVRLFNILPLEDKRAHDFTELNYWIIPHSLPILSHITNSLSSLFFR